MSNQTDKARHFRSLHVAGKPIVLFNVWDPGSATAVAAAGAPAIATGSAPVAMAQGFKDGEQIPLSLALDNIERIVATVDLPVTMDLEAGYGASAETVADTVGQAMARGIVGYNLEDQVIGGDGLHSIADQCARIDSARQATDQSGVPGFLNARTDIFLKAKPADHTASMVDEAIERARAFEQAGADGFFAPGLADEAFIDKLCNTVPLPVNIIALPHVPPKARLIELGVARISYGPVPYRQMIQQLQDAATAAFD